MKFNDIVEEVKSIYTGKIIDATLPPLIFVLVSTFIGLTEGVVISVITSLSMVVFRLWKKQTLKYSMGGLLGVLFATSLAFISKNASNFFLPKIIGSTSFLVLTIISLIIKKPLTAWASHLTRGWDLNWYWRKDILPAYNETTIIWIVFIGLRLTAQVVLFFNVDLIKQGIFNIILGFPLTLFVLVLTYVFGIWRLKKLKGPGIDEFLTNAPPPWKGQTKGF